MSLNIGEVRVPSIVIREDRKLDEEIIIEFFKMKHPMISQYFPHFKSIDNIKMGITDVYESNRTSLEETIRWLKNNRKTIGRLAEIIAKKLDYSWTGIETITIIPALSPISPRFLDDHSFMVPFHNDHNRILYVSSHEMVHFLYFQKLQYLLGKKIDTEYPSEDWLISEIVAPLIVNTKEIQNIVHTVDEFFSPDPKVVSGERIKQVEELFIKEPDLVKFRNQVINKNRAE